VEAYLDKLIAHGLLIAFRIGGLMTFAPFFSNASIPWRVRAILTLLITAALVPLYGSTPPAGLSPLRAIAGELAIGFALGLSTQFVLEAANLAGQIMGMQVGYSLVNLIDPTTEVDTPVLSVFHQLMAVLLFLDFNGHHWMLRTLARSFEYIPAGSVTSAISSTTALVAGAKVIFIAGVQLAAPVLAITVLTDVALAFLGRAVPQLPVLFIGLTLKTWLAFAVVIGSVTLWPRLFSGYFQNAFRFSEHLLRAWH
jgi:flagellar biosynthesis protein FliR